MYFKRLFDFSLSLVLLAVFWWLILLCWIISSIETRSNGFFMQERIGMHGRRFNIYKIKTMRPCVNYQTNITQANDPRITRIGALFRRTKIDELPQLVNVLLGDMSFVGPRPDVPGYADNLESGTRELLLSIRPGITGPASLIYRDEEQILSLQQDPSRYNDEVIYPDKVRINLEYIQNWRFLKDINYILKTIFH